VNQTAKAPRRARKRAPCRRCSQYRHAAVHDRQDYEDARKGFIDTLPDAVITNARRVEWTLAP
jgi:alkyl sulfatase BDS1-like metallo-beta-lactamase superfamily hydrolase